MIDEDARIEELLRTYQVRGPAATMRNRIVIGRQSPSSRWWSVGRWAIAAGLILTIGLQLYSARLDRQISGLLESERTVWTVEAEELTRMLDGDNRGRRYLALRLAIGRGGRGGMNFFRGTGPIHSGEI